MGDPIACADCRAFYTSNRDTLTAACASVGIEHGITQGEALRMYLDGYHDAGHDRERRMSAYRVAARALDVQGALRKRGHHVTDEAALNIVRTWRDTNGGPTAMCRALILAGVHPFSEPDRPATRECWYGDLDAVWAALGSSARPSNITRPDGTQEAG